MTEDRTASSPRDRNSKRSSLRLLVYLMLFIGLIVLGYQAAKGISVVKRKDSEKITVAQIDEGRRRDAIKSLEMAEAALGRGELEQVRDSLKLAKGLDLEGLQSARIAMCRHRYDQLIAEKEKEVAEKELIANEIQSEVNMISRALDSADLVSSLEEVQHKIKALSEKAKAAEISDVKGLDAVVEKFSKRARSITNARYSSLIGRIKTNQKGEELGVNDWRGLVDSLEAELKSPYLSKESVKDGNRWLEKARKRLAYMKKRQQFSTMLKAEDWSGAEVLMDELATEGERLELHQELVAAKTASEEAKLKAAELLKEVESMDDGNYNAEALLLLDELLKVAPNDQEVLALRAKILSYRDTIRVPGDFASLDEALSVAKSGDKVLLGKGVFYSSAKIQKALILEGAGAGETIFETSGESGAALQLASDKGSIRVSKLTIRGSELIEGKERHPLVLVANDCLMEDVEIENAGGHGIALVQGRLDMKRCKISNSGWDGVTVRGKKSHVVLTDCLITQSGEHGVDFWEGSVGTVFRSKIQHSGKSGIVVTGAPSRVTVANVSVEGARDAGIYISGGALVHLDRLTARSNQLSGIVIQDEKTQVKFSAVVCSNNGQAGVVIAPGSIVQGVQNLSGEGNLDGLVVKKKIPSVKEE